MGQAKHEPGEWSYSGPDVPGKLGARYVRDRAGMPVAKVCSLERSDAEADANGRLMAAAPDLLSACRDVLDLMASCRAATPEAWAEREAKAAGIRKRLIVTVAAAEGE